MRRWWSGGGGTVGTIFSLLLYPASVVFGVAVRLRNTAYDRGWRERGAGPIPVVSVGNLSVGGTGKTPVTAWLGVLLSDMGAKPAIVSRGYGRDELALHATWNPEIPVHSAPDRLLGILRAAEAGATVALLDDGFQHRRAERDLDLVLLAVEQPFPPRLLPRGPFREPLSSLKRADLVLLTRKSATSEAADQLEAALLLRHPGLDIVRIHLRPSRWKTLGGEPSRPPEGDTLALSSIAEPDTFLDLVREAVGGGVATLAFPDHHEYTAGDIERIHGAAKGSPIVTTEKDAVKLVAFAARLPDVRVLGLEVAVEAGEDRLRDALQAVLAPEPGSPA